MRAPGPVALTASTLVAHRDRVSGSEVLGVIDATADAGFQAMTAWSPHQRWAQEDGIDAEAYAEYHRERDLQISLVSVATQWTRSGSDPIHADDAQVLEVATLLGAPYVLAACVHPELDWVAAAAGLAALCDRAADRGLGVSIEFMPKFGLPSLEATMRLIADADRDNAGVVLDVWHWATQPGGIDLDALRAVPADRVHCLQLNDAPDLPREVLLERGMTARLIPGTGVLDLAGIIAVLDEIGATPIVVSEVFSIELLSEVGPTGKARLELAAAGAILGQD